MSDPPKTIFEKESARNTFVGFVTVFVLAALGIGTYFFSIYVEESKSDNNQQLGIEDYISIVIVWVGSLVVIGLLLREFAGNSERVQNNSKHLSHLYHNKKFLFFNIVFLLVLMVIVLSLFIFFIFSETEPPKIKQNECAPCTSSLMGLKHPSEINS